jgi:predicted transcriptional regulator
VEFEGAILGPSAVRRNYPVRLLDETRIFLAVLDDIAGVCFPTLDGRVDMATMLVLRDPRGYRWAEDLFLHLWERARERLG